MKIFGSFLLLMAYGAAQQATPAPADPNSVIRVETNVVLVDAVVTDKKGNYVHDLQQKDFKVYEDNKEYHSRAFFEADPASPLSKQPRYLVLFFDNSTMNFGDQVLARKAATTPHRCQCHPEPADGDRELQRVAAGRAEFYQRRGAPEGDCSRNEDGDGPVSE